MKQAYTNTIRGSARNPLTIATASKKGNRSKQQLPKCAYGAACTRKGCAYRHPSPTDAPYESYHEDPRSKICKPFLAGLCSYGHKCMNRHPAQQEADAVRATYKEKTCSYGDDCQTEGCLYWHPWEGAEVVHESADYTGELTSAMGGLQMEVPTYEQWMTMNCPAPPTMDENAAYNLWHYPGSGMQRNPWEVYCLMYPESYSNDGLNATSQTWEPTMNNVHVAPHAAPQSWESASTLLQQNEEPRTFQEWKKKGQPYPSWFCSDLDPWYDDEGVRRSLEEVYEVLYGLNAEENFAQKQHAHQIASDPTPAEVAAMSSTNQLGTSPGGTLIQLGTSPGGSILAKGGWASIAAKPPAPVQKTVPVASNGVGAISGNGIQTASSAISEQKRQTIIIPKEVWLPSTANSDCFHLFPNPIERFKAVNSHHKSYLGSVTIPICFDNNNNSRGSSPNQTEHPKKGSGKVALLDVHFQSAKTITPVLNRFLVPALKKNDEAWIVTGSGHHVAVGHQKREGGGVLFNAVKRYLEENEEELALEFRVGKDTSGGKNKSSGGAFLVRRAP